MYTLSWIVTALCLLSGAESHGQLVTRQLPEIRIRGVLDSSTIRVLENAPMGTYVAHVLVVSDGTVTCSAHSARNIAELVRLTSDEYELALTTLLDREAEPSHSIQIVCTSFGPSPLTSTATLTLIVDDVNDNMPVFPHPSFIFNVGRSAPVGTELGRVQAFDMDSNENGAIRYHLRSFQGQANDLVLAIDEDTGLLTTTRILGPEVAQREVLFVVAEDQGLPSFSATAIVLLTVQDEGK